MLKAAFSLLLLVANVPVGELTDILTEATGLVLTKSRDDAVEVPVVASTYSVLL